MELLENDPTNTCWGCGPANPDGLKLEFHHDGDSVVCQRQVQPHETGWPGLGNIGLHMLTLFETAYWTPIGLRNELGMVTHADIDVKRLPLVGTVPTCRGRIVKETDDGWIIEATSEDEKGRPLVKARAQLTRVTNQHLAAWKFTLPDHLMGHIRTT